MEALSLLGDIAGKDGTATAHVHVVLGRRDGSVVDRRLLSGNRPALIDLNRSR